ncbi:hypothetical protein FRB90_000144 [Tulasnella sp. 427]|nr:hypothetical protein FRB90_000144 [Tulasnella sp. 427]
MDEPRSRKATFQLRTANYNDHSSSRRSSSVLSRSHSPSPTPSETYQGNPVIVGVCAMDIKARSKAMREILTRLVARGRGNIEVKVFGDKVILDEDVENWPRCDILISFFSTDFPLKKAVDYVRLRQPVCINDLSMQELLWDRRCVLKILDHVGVPCPLRVEVSRDGGPQISDEVKAKVEESIGLKLEWPVNSPDFKVREDKDAIIVDGKVMEKPFVEKPVSGEDHNINIYYRGGGGRRLFRKIGNQSSTYDPDLVEPRTDGSYIYEEFIDVENAEDIKVYTVGSTYTHAETRKSPVIDGLVRRNTEGKEIRFITRLSDEEILWARKICEGFGQRVCGFDVLRPKGSERSMVIDVNGWSFVKGNESYYVSFNGDLASSIAQPGEGPAGAILAPSGQVTGGLGVAVQTTKGPGTVGGKRLEKFQLVFKWGGEFTHAARYQSRDLGENLRKDISILNKDMLNNVQIFTSSERRVTASAEIFAAALLDNNTPRNVGHINPGSPLPLPHTPPTRSSRSSEAGSAMDRPAVPCYKLIIRKDLLDDSNAAKELTDDVKKRLKILLRNGESERRPELTWPKNMKAEPAQVVQEVIQLMSSFRTIMRKNYETVDVDKIQERWCCGDDPFLFRERWEKMFDDFCDVKQEKFDPSRVSELYDALKFSALHHRTFLFAIFSENGGKVDPNDRRLHELYSRAKALFDLVAPQEYGIEPSEKEEIGVLTSLPLLRKIVADLEAVRNSGGSGLTVYFTKESHIHTLVNLVLFSGLPIANPRIPELDYSSHITFELYERSGGHNKTDKEYSIRLSISEGAHSSNVLDSALDARHALNVKPRRKLTQHLDYGLVIEKLSKHFHRVPEDEDEEPLEAIDVPLANGHASDGSRG